MTPERNEPADYRKACWGGSDAPPMLHERAEVAREIGMGLLFSGLVDDFRGEPVMNFCNQMSDYLHRKYKITPREETP